MTKQNVGKSKAYELPMLKIVSLERQDVVTASGDGDSKWTPQDKYYGDIF